MGVERIILRPGTGVLPRAKQTVTVHCRGMLQASRKEFWATTPDQPFSFVIGVGQVIRGWDEGVAQMRVGEKSELVCTADFAYGQKGFPAWGIGPGAGLIFEIELLNAQ